MRSFRLVFRSRFDALAEGLTIRARRAFVVRPRRCRPAPEHRNRPTRRPRQEFCAEGDRSARASRREWPPGSGRGGMTGRWLLSRLDMFNLLRDQLHVCRACVCMRIGMTAMSWNFIETCSQQEGLVERAAGRTRVSCLEGLRYIAMLSFDNKYLHAKRSNFCRRFVGRRFLERAAGIEPASPAWKAGVLPLHNARVGSA